MNDGSNHEWSKGERHDFLDNIIATNACMLIIQSYYSAFYYHTQALSAFAKRRFSLLSAANLTSLGTI